MHQLGWNWTIQIKSVILFWFRAPSKLSITDSSHPCMPNQMKFSNTISIISTNNLTAKIPLQSLSSKWQFHTINFTTEMNKCVNRERKKNSQIRIQNILHKMCIRTRCGSCFMYFFLSPNRMQFHCNYDDDDNDDDDCVNGLNSCVSPSW